MPQAADKGFKIGGKFDYFKIRFLCGGLLVFAQGTNRVKNAEISERRGFRRFFVSGKVTLAFSQNRAGMRGFLFEVDGIGNFLKLF